MVGPDWMNLGLEALTHGGNPLDLAPFSSHIRVSNVYIYKYTNIIYMYLHSLGYELKEFGKIYELLFK